MTRDPAKIEAAWKALDAAMQDESGDTSWADDLPEAPPSAQTVAVFHSQAQGSSNSSKGAGHLCGQIGDMK